MRASADEARMERGELDLQDPTGRAALALTLLQEAER